MGILLLNKYLCGMKCESFPFNEKEHWLRKLVLFVNLLSKF
jgi:hypothetical protein